MLSAKYFYSCFMLCFFFMLQPWLSVPNLSFYDQQRWIEILFLAAVFPVVLSYVCFRQLSNYMIAAFVFAGFSTVYNQAGWVLPIRLFFWFFVFLSAPFFYIYLDNKFRAFFLFVFVFSTTLYCLYTLCGLLLFISSGTVDASYVVTSFSNVNHAAGSYLLIVLTIPVVMDFFKKNKSIVFLSVANIFVFVFLLFVIGSRGAILSLLLIIFLSFFVRIISVKQFGVLLLRVFISALVLYGFLYLFTGIFDKTHGFDALYADSGRFELYKKAISGSIEKPVLGHGPLSFSLIGDINVAHAHNVVLNALYEFGYFFVIFISLYIVRQVGLLRESFISETISFSEVCALAVSFGFFIHSQFSGLTMIPATLFVFLFSSAQLFMRPILYNNNIVMGFSARRLWFGVFLSVLYFYLVLESWSKVSGGAAFAPRFWLLSN